MSYDKKCKWHKSCGYDFCHGEGICPEFEKGKSPKETEKESGVEDLVAKENTLKIIQLIYNNSESYELQKHLAIFFEEKENE